MSFSAKERNLIRLALKKLEGGAAAFNEWRVSQGRKWLHLTERDFSGRDLTQIDFTGVKLTGSKFCGAILRQAKFTAANVNQADFTGADLTNADFQGARMHFCVLDRAKVDGCSFFGALRDGWSVKGVDCRLAWISRPREEGGNSYQLFKPGEFEAVHGGARIRISFNGDFEPIDLLALPFYAKDILDRFRDRKLVFAGLSALGEPALEFRIEQLADVAPATEAVQEHFNRRLGELRRSMELLVERQLRLENRDQHMTKLVDTLAYLRDAKGGPQNYYLTMGDTYIQKQGVQGRTVHADRMVQFNAGDAAQLKALAAELAQLGELLKAVPTASADDKAAIEKAAQSADRGDGAGVLDALNSAGKWLFGFCEKVGVTLAAAALKQAAGL